MVVPVLVEDAEMDGRGVGVEKVGEAIASVIGDREAVRSSKPLTRDRLI